MFVAKVTLFSSSMYDGISLFPQGQDVELGRQAEDGAAPSTEPEEFGSWSSSPQEDSRLRDVSPVCSDSLVFFLLGRNSWCPPPPTHTPFSCQDLRGAAVYFLSWTKWKLTCQAVMLQDGLTWGRGAAPHLGERPSHTAFWNNP